MNWLIKSRSEMKKQGKVNEDSIYTGQDLCIVSDGISRNNSGEVASKMTVQYLSKNVSELLSQNPAESEIVERISDIVSEVSEKVYRASLEKSRLNGMSATLDLLVKRGDRAYNFHVGDSCVFVLDKNGTMEKITIDDTYIGHMYADEQIPIGVYYTHPRRNKIEKSIGKNEPVSPTHIDFSLKDVKYILMTSDGISSYLTEKQITNILSTYQTSEIMDRLFEIRKRPEAMAKIFKNNCEEYSDLELDEIIQILSDVDDASAILIENIIGEQNASTSFN